MTEPGLSILDELLLPSIVESIRAEHVPVSDIDPIAPEAVEAEELSRAVSSSLAESYQIEIVQKEENEAIDFGLALSLEGIGSHGEPLLIDTNSNLPVIEHSSAGTIITPGDNIVVQEIGDPKSTRMDRIQCILEAPADYWSRSEIIICSLGLDTVTLVPSQNVILRVPIRIEARSSRKIIFVGQGSKTYVYAS